MNASYTAGVVQVILANLNPQPGISPPPVPPSAVFPYATVQVQAIDEIESHDGPSGLTKTTVQVNCWHPDYELADSLRRDISALLLKFKGQCPNTDLVIQGSNDAGSAELYDGVRELHQLITRATVWWTR